MLYSGPDKQVPPRGREKRVPPRGRPGKRTLQSVVWGFISRKRGTSPKQDENLGPFVEPIELSFRTGAPHSHVAQFRKARYNPGRRLVYCILGDVRG